MPQKRTFEQFMQEVDKHLANYGVSHEDIDDYCYRDAYDDGETPKTTARRAMAAARN